MSILPENYQPALNPLYVAVGSFPGLELTPFITKPLTVNQSVIITELNDKLLPRVGVTYSVTIGLVLDLEYIAVTLQYDDRHTTVIAHETSPIELSLSAVLTKVISPTIPLQLTLTNLSGANIDDGNYKISTISIVELPTPIVLTKESLTK